MTARYIIFKSKIDISFLYKYPLNSVVDSYYKSPVCTYMYKKNNSLHWEKKISDKFTMSLMKTYSGNMSMCQRISPKGIVLPESRYTKFLYLYFSITS